MDFLISQTRAAIDNLKKLDFFQEDKRDFFYLNNFHNEKINDTLKKKIHFLRKKFCNEIRIQNYNKKTTESMVGEINRLQLILYSSNFERKYINTSSVIPEETVEFKDSSICTSKINYNEDHDMIKEYNERRILRKKSLSIPKLNFTLIQKDGTYNIKDETINSIYGQDNKSVSNEAETNNISTINNINTQRRRSYSKTLYDKNFNFINSNGFFNELKNNFGNNHYNSFDIRDMVNDKDYLNKSNIKKEIL